MIVLNQDEGARVRAGLQTMAIQVGKRRWWPGGKPHPLQECAFGAVFGYGRVISVDQKRLGQLTEEDAGRCGFSSVSALKDDWRRRHRRRNRWHPNRLVWLVRFVYTGVPEEYKQRTVFDLLREVSTP